VIDAVTRAYAEEYANVHRGLHYLSNLATEKYESVRGTIARFLGAPNEDEIVLNTGSSTDGDQYGCLWLGHAAPAGRG
jgi:cysteine desulfurase/selenocysteine lyase